MDDKRQYSAQWWSSPSNKWMCTLEAQKIKIKNSVKTRGQTKKQTTRKVGLEFIIKSSLWQRLSAHPTNPHEHSHANTSSSTTAARLMQIGFEIWPSDRPSKGINKTIGMMTNNTIGYDSWSCCLRQCGTYIQIVSVASHHQKENWKLYLRESQHSTAQMNVDERQKVW